MPFDIKLLKTDSAIIIHDDGSATVYLSKETDEYGFAIPSAIMAAAVLNQLSDPDKMQKYIDELDTIAEDANGNLKN